jgi:flagellin
MAVAISGGSRIRTNTPAENAYNALQSSSDNLALRQLRLSTGKRINSASDDVSGYITSRALTARNGSLNAALSAAGEAKNVTSIVQDSLDSINGLLTTIKDSASTAASGALGTDEKVALAKSAYRLSQQIQTTVDSTVFGGEQLIKGSYTGDWVIGFTANNTILTIGVNLQTNNLQDFNLDSNFDLNATDSTTTSFAGVTGLSLNSLNSVSTTDLGIFSSSQIVSTLTSLSAALNNVNKVTSYIGGVYNRLTSQEDLLKSQVTNYDSAISRIQDTDVAKEQLELVKAQFLQQSSLVSLTQANQAPSTYLSLLK